MTTGKATRNLSFQDAMTYTALIYGRKAAQNLQKEVTDRLSTVPTEVYVWKPIDPSTIKKPEQKYDSDVYGTEVGVGENIEHLNKRRQRARLEKQRAAVRFLRDLDSEENPESQRKGLGSVLGMDNVRQLQDRMRGTT
jgi:hypothetical protein